MTDENDGILATLAVQALVFVSALIGAIGTGLWAWANAPVVGGDFWPYIRVGAALVGALIGAKVGAVVMVILAFLGLGLFGVGVWLLSVVSGR